MCGFDKGEPVRLPEWSKGLRSGRKVFERVGSNPTADTSFCYRAQQSAVTSTHVLVSLFAVYWAHFCRQEAPDSLTAVSPHGRFRRLTTRHAAQHMIANCFWDVCAFTFVAFIKCSR